MKRVLLTGAAGAIGTAFREAARDRFAFRCLDRVATPGATDAVVADLTDLPALERAAAGCDAVVHLGARRDPDDFLTAILPDNIIGTYHAYEAARRAKVPRFVFASSGQVEAHRRGTLVTPDMPPRTLNNYAASKALGEHLGFMYASRFALTVVCLRIGWVALPRDREELEASGEGALAWTISARDIAGVLAAAVDAAGVGYEILQAYGRQAAPFRDLDRLQRVLGYSVQDDCVALHRQGRLF